MARTVRQPLLGMGSSSGCSSPWPAAVTGKWGCLSYLAFWFWMPLADSPRYRASIGVGPQGCPIDSPHGLAPQVLTLVTKCSFSRDINECKIIVQFLVLPLSDVFRVEFDKQRWTSLCVLLSAEEHVPFQDAFREGGRVGKIQSLIVSCYFSSIARSERSSWPLTLLRSLILGKGGKICTAENRLKCDGYTQCSDTKAKDTFKTLIRWDIMARLCSCRHAFKVRRQQFCTISFSGLQMV